jgi:hypothetical protein
MFKLNDLISKLKDLISKLRDLKNINRNTILIGVAVIAIVITGVLIFAKSNIGFSLPNIFGMSDNQVGKRAVDYINNNQLSQTPASLVSVSEESGLVKVKIKIGDSEFDSYATKDGKLLFPQAFDMSPATDSASTDNAAGASSILTPEEAAAAITKTDKPMLDAYIVARCPFGLQMQRMMADAIKSVPALAQYMKVRYIGSVSGNTITAMHGDAEAQENLRQICIRDEQPAKYWSYVACQMKTGDTAGCQTSTGVNAAQLNACVSDPARGIADAQKDFDLSAQYKVSGSPTLILGGKSVSEFNFGGRTSDAVKSIVCAAFNSQPSFCSTKINTAEAAASFSATYSSSTATAAGSSGANCAPAQ